MTSLPGAGAFEWKLSEGLEWKLDDANDVFARVRGWFEMLSENWKMVDGVTASSDSLPAALRLHCCLSCLKCKVKLSLGITQKIMRLQAVATFPN